MSETSWILIFAMKIVPMLKKMQFIRPSSNSFYNCHNPRGIRFVKRLRTGLSHLREHKFKNSFQDSSFVGSVLMSNYVSISSSTVLYFNMKEAPCAVSISRNAHTLLSTVRNMDSKLLDHRDLPLTQVLLIDDASLDVNINTSILNVTIDFVIFLQKIWRTTLLNYKFLWWDRYIFLLDLCYTHYIIYVKCIMSIFDLV